MFFVLLNEDQTRGFFLAKVLPPPFSTWSSGAAEIEELVPPQERSISSPLLSPSIHFILPLSPTLSLISLSGTQSVSGSLSEFIISLRRPWPRWIRALKFFHQHLGEAGETVRETKCDKAQETHQRGFSSVWTGPEGWNVCVHKPVTRQRVRADVRWGLGPD